MSANESCLVGAVASRHPVEDPRVLTTMPTISAAEARAVADCSGPLDRVAALLRTEGDVELLAEMARIFLCDSPRLVSNVRSAVSRAVPLEIEHAAHELKGCVGNFAAHDAFNAAANLEMLGHLGQMAGVREAAERLEAELERLEPAMRGLTTARV